MKLSGLVILALILSPFALLSQVEYEVYRSTHKPAASYTPSDIELKYSPILVNGEVPKPGIATNREKIRKLKEQIKPIPAKGSRKTTKASNSAPSPIILDSLEGNSYNGSVPNDNSFSINRDGIIISVKNTNILIYDTKTDQVLLETTLILFSRDLAISGSKYDPRVIYDPDADRFIIVFLNGTIFEQSKIVLAFAKSSDPMEGFYLYALDGNPLDNDTWSDYPHITLGKEELFITMNTFFNGSTNNSGYVESTIRMVDKWAGYDSLLLDEAYFFNLSISNKNMFNFTGLAPGRELYEGPAYFMSNRNLDLSNDSLFLARITGHLSDPVEPKLDIRVIYSSIPYGLPPDARQSNNHRFDCNDTRIQGGFVQNNVIQFVGNTVNSFGQSSFYHGVYDLFRDGDTALMNIIEYDSLDYGYPNISYTGKSKYEREAIIAFNHSGPNTFAGFSALFYDNDGSYSDAIMISKGRGYVDIISDTSGNKYERWGDYTGIQPDYTTIGQVWASGYNTAFNGRPLTTMAHLRSPRAGDPPTADDSNVAGTGGIVTESKREDLRWGPNPTRENVNVSFIAEEDDEITFSLYSMGGLASAERTELLVQPVVKGRVEFTFNIAKMAAGTYYLIVTNQSGEVLLEEKILKL
jgi:hypothetical protein